MKLSVLFLMFLEFVGIGGKSNIKTTASTGTLTVIVSNFRNDHGNATVILFNSEETFPRYPEKAVKIAHTPINNKKSVTVFDNLPAGTYAISAYHDENNNKKMDTNFFGVPKEGVGASNNARGHFGPPKYKDAKFNFNGNSQTITISITYL